MSVGKISKSTKSKREKKIKEPKQDDVLKQTDNVDMEEVLDAKSEVTSFTELGLSSILCEECERLNYKKPTPIQAQVIPYALQGKDIMGLAATGSGKTAAFALPVLHDLYEQQTPFFCVVLAPARELAYQITDQFKSLGTSMGLRVCTIIGGEGMMQQALNLASRPHVIVATPGRLLEHLEKTKGFSLQKLKYLVLDEADKLLSRDFQECFNKILTLIPRNRHTYLFSATESDDVERLQRASLTDPVKVKVNDITTVSELIERMLIVTPEEKDAAIVAILNSEGAGKSMIIFTNTKDEASRIPILLELLGHSAAPLHGDMSQNERHSSLNKFKSGAKKILIATNVASRGLDIPSVDLVINYQVPENSDDYIHRVGRTARAGRHGKAITFVNQYDAPRFLSIEQAIYKNRPGRRIEQLELEKEDIMIFRQTIDDAQREARIRLRELNEKRKRRRDLRLGKSKRPRNDDRDANA